MREKTKLYQRHKTSAFYLYPVLRIGNDSVTRDPVEVIKSDDNDNVGRILVEKLIEKARGIRKI